MKRLLLAFMLLAWFGGNEALAQYGWGPPGPPSIYRSPYPSYAPGPPGPPAEEVYTYGYNPYGSMIDRSVRPIPGATYYPQGGIYIPTYGYGGYGYGGYGYNQPYGGIGYGGYGYRGSVRTYGINRYGW